MKKVFFATMLAISIINFSFTEDTNPLIGRWEWSTKHVEGPLTILAVFKTNGIYDGFANKKNFVTGTYQVKHDTLFIADPICNAKYNATYKLKFFGKQDSVQFNVIQDTCAQRRKGIDGFVYKRLPAAKK
ncbi:hypothetical protein [Pedobacter duraquae]|uniref:Lipocalin-like protein n=1 Tax=Pedobacter duraquae TaxID=425511 RepID=A0A4R6IG72_9SPHI|nr:hypothetical protein [Pedobacter duraquae]TDO20816.1 hypothetical protein CLV32_3450 [Pedobacter duraquae]